MINQHKSKQALLNEVEALKIALEMLKNSILPDKHVLKNELVETDKLNSLNCLFQISEILKDTQLSAELLVEKVAQQLANVLRYPENAFIAIKIDEIIRTQGKLNGGENSIQQKITLANGNSGEIIIAYSCSEAGSNLEFLTEEKLLLNTVANLLENFFNKNEKEIRLKHSEMLYSAAINTSPDAIIITDMNGFLLFSSAVGAKMFGFSSAKEMVGKHIFDFIAKTEIPLALSNIQKALAGKLKNKLEYTGIKANGTAFAIEINADIINNTDGKPENFVYVTRDISKRKESENKVRQLTSAVEQSPVSIVITNTNGIIEYANPKACTTSGYSFDELVGKNPNTLKSGFTHESEYEILWNTIKNGNEWQGYFHNKRKNGELYWEKAGIAPIVDANGIATHYIAVKEDITEQKAIEEALQRSEKALNDAQEIALIGSYEFNYKTGKKYFSKNLFNLLGYKEESGISPFDYFIEHVHKDDKNAIVKLFFDSDDNYKELTFEFSIVNHTDAVRRFQNHTVQVFEDNIPISMLQLLKLFPI